MHKEIKILCLQVSSNRIHWRFENSYHILGKLRKCRSEIPVSSITALATEPDDILEKSPVNAQESFYLCCSSIIILKSSLKKYRKHLFIIETNTEAPKAI